MLICFTTISIVIMDNKILSFCKVNKITATRTLRKYQLEVIEYYTRVKDNGRYTIFDYWVKIGSFKHI